jgi:hypothetical protein
MYKAALILACGTVMGFAALTALVPGTSAAFAQQPVTFACGVPDGHICQFVVRTAVAPISFAVPSGERTEIAGVTPGIDKYCVCDPGPVTPDCTAPQVGYWCSGFWADVVAGPNPPQ